MRKKDLDLSVKLESKTVNIYMLAFDSWHKIDVDWEQRAEMEKNEIQ